MYFHNKEQQKTTTNSDAKLLMDVNTLAPKLDTPLS